MGYEAWASAALAASKKVLTEPKKSEFDEFEI